MQQKISADGELVVKSHCVNNIQYNTKCYWEKSQQQNNTIPPKFTIVHLCLNLIPVTEVNQIPKSVCNRNQKRKALQMYYICLTDSDHNCIIDEIKCIDTTEYYRDICVEDNE